MRRVGFMTAHKNFKRFLKRLRRLRQKKAIPINFYKLLPKYHLNKIVDLSEISKTQIKIIYSLIKKSEKILNLAQKLMDFFCSSFIAYLPKRKNGRYRLYLEKKNRPEDRSMQVLWNLQNIKMRTEIVLNVLEQKNGCQNFQHEVNKDDKNKPLIFSMLQAEDEAEVSVLHFTHMKDHHTQKLSGAELVKRNVLYRWEDNSQKWSDVGRANRSVSTISPSSHLQISHKQT